MTGQFHETPKGLLCRACFSYWRRTGNMKTHGPVKRTEPTRMHIGGTKQKRKPPKNMYCDIKDVKAITNGPPGHGELMLKLMDADIVTLKRNVQNNKQMIGQNKHRIAQGIKGMTKELAEVRSCGLRSVVMY